MQKLSSPVLLKIHEPEIFQYKSRAKNNEFNARSSKYEYGKAIRTSLYRPGCDAEFNVILPECGDK